MDRAGQFVCRTLLPAVGLLALTCIAYVPAMRGDFIWDDDYYVTGNPTLRDADGLRRIWLEIASPGEYILPQYYPLVHTTFWVEYHLWELNPLGYHVVNVLLHAGSALLLWAVLRRLKLPGAGWAAAIFALHPVHVESVAWITERKNVLSGFFYLLSAMAYLRFARLGEAGEPEDLASRRWGYYLLAIACFACALLSKTVVATLPAAMLLIIWWKRARIGWRDVVLLAPMFAMGLLMGRLTAWMEVHRVGATGPEWDFSFAERCLIAGRALWFYAAKLLWPHPLIFFYYRWNIDAAARWQYLFPAAAVAVVIALWMLRRRLGRGPLVAACFFGLTVAPALGFANVFPMIYSFVADHFQYLASIGLICLFVGTVVTVLDRLGGRHAAAAVFVPLLGLLAGLTWWQGGDYRDLETLWRQTMKKNPSSWIAYNNLGVDLLKQWKFGESEWMLRKAIELEPANGRAYFNLGNLLTQTGRPQEAMGYLLRARELVPGLPNAHVFLGDALAALGRWDEAFGSYEKALSIDRMHERGWVRYGDALARAGRVEEAIQKYSQALRNDPYSFPAHFALGNLLMKLGHVPQAIDHLQQAVECDPTSGIAHNSLGMLLGQLDRLPEAEAEFRKAIALNERIPEAHNNLGSVLQIQGKYSEAIQCFEDALRLKPDFALARQNLDRAVAHSQGQ